MYIFGNFKAFQKNWIFLELYKNNHLQLDMEIVFSHLQDQLESSKLSPPPKTSSQHSNPFQLETDLNLLRKKKNNTKLNLKCKQSFTTSVQNPDPAPPILLFWSHYPWFVMLCARTTAKNTPFPREDLNAGLARIRPRYPGKTMIAPMNRHFFFAFIIYRLRCRKDSERATLRVEKEPEKRGFGKNWE